MRTDWDVIVVGGGGSGLATAASAAEHGCSVLVLEKQPFIGGTTSLAVGSFTANRTPWQRKAGLEDSVQAHAEDLAKFAAPELEARNNAELRAYFLEHGAATLEWLKEMGLSFFGPSPEPPNRIPRMHNVVPGARAYVLALQKRVLRLGGRIECEAPVVSLAREGGRIVGVRTRIGGAERELRATRGVVLAAGDYANAPELIAEFKGGRFSAIEGINPNAGGDGQRLARSAGAPLINMDVTYGPEIRFVPPPRPPLVQRLPSSGPLARVLGGLAPLLPRFLLNLMVKRLLVTWQHPDDALFRDGAILLDGRGDRFCDELKTPEREIAVASRPEKQAFILLDQRLCERYSAWPHFISTAPRIAYAYVADYERLRPDVTRAGRTLGEAAVRAGLPAAAVEAAVARYNGAVRAGHPDEFGRGGERHALEGGRWVLLGPAKAYFTTTEGSPAINRRFEVLDGAGRPIPGLYAVGQNGLGGQILWCHGLHIGWALTSGRLAGRLLAGKAAG